MRKTVGLVGLFCMVISMQAKTLVAYYSYTSNIHRIVEALVSQIEADVVRIEPAEKGVDYAADNYAVGSAQIAAIRANPGDASSYPGIDPLDVDWDAYDTVIIGTPLWWSNMAAPMQTFLFNNGDALAGKHIGLIVSSASSGISGVEADARRLIPEGDFFEPTLWVRSAQTSDAQLLVGEWLKETGYYGMIQDGMDNRLSIRVNGRVLTASLVDNSSTGAIKELLASGPLTVHMSDYGNMEKVGALPQPLPTNDRQINTVAGDLILYQGRNFVIYYDTNSWNFTRLGKIDGISSGQDLKRILGEGDVDVVLSWPGTSSIPAAVNDNADDPGMVAFDLSGRRIAPSGDGVSGLPSGVYIVNGKKTNIN